MVSYKQHCGRSHYLTVYQAPENTMHFGIQRHQLCNIILFNRRDETERGRWEELDLFQIVTLRESKTNIVATYMHTHTQTHTFAPTHMWLAIVHCYYFITKPIARLMYCINTYTDTQNLNVYTYTYINEMRTQYECIWGHTKKFSRDRTIGHTHTTRTQPTKKKSQRQFRGLSPHAPAGTYKTSPCLYSLLLNRIGM